MSHAWANSLIIDATDEHASVRLSLHAFSTYKQTFVYTLVTELAIHEERSIPYIYQLHTPCVLLFPFEVMFRKNNDLRGNNRIEGQMWVPRVNGQTKCVGLSCLVSMDVWANPVINGFKRA